MKLSDIVKELQVTLPRYTSLFNENITVASLTLNGNEVTVITSGNHNQVAGNEITVKGVKIANPIAYLTQSNGIGRLVTQYNHDVTYNSQLNEGDSSQIKISGASEAGYNSTFDIISIPNSNVIEFVCNDNLPSSASGSPALEEDISFFINGKRTILSIVNATTFKFILTNDEIPYVGDIKGNITINTGIRFSIARTINQAYEAYTKQSINKLWGFIVYDNSSASRSRNNNSDAIISYSGGVADIEYIVDFSIYVFIPSTQNICLSDEIDLATHDVKIALMKTLHLMKYSTGFSDNIGYITLINDSILDSPNNAVTVWQYRFQSKIRTTNKDGATNEYTRALRGFKINNYIMDGAGNMIAEGDLPDEKVISGD